MATTKESDSPIKTILIIGAVFPATPIIRALDNANIAVHVAHPRAPSDPYKKVTYHECDNTSSTSLKPILDSIKPDLIISTVSGGSHSTQKTLIDTAIETGIPRFIPYEFGQDTLNTAVQDRIPPSRERARTIEYLKTFSSHEENNISWVGIATGVDLDRGLLNGNLGFDIKWQSATIHGQGHERFAASSSAWIGRVVLAVIQRWEDVKNSYLYASGLTTTGDEVVAAFEKATGKEFVASHADVEDCVREAQQRIERGFPDAGMFLMARSVMYDEGIGAVRRFEEEDAKARLGLEAERLGDVVEWVVHESKHHDKGGCGCD